MRRNLCSILVTGIFISLSWLLQAQESDYSLPVDPVADLFSFMHESFTEDGAQKLAMFSYNENALLIYDLATKSIERKVIYDTQGPNALNNMRINGGMKMVNKDTIIFFDNQLQRFYLSDNQGEIYHKQQIESSDVVFSSADLESSIAYRKGYIYVQGWPVTIGPNSAKDYKNFPNYFGKISLKDGSVERLKFDFPASYKGKDYSQELKDASILYNERIDKFIISFPISHEIYVTDFNGHTQTHMVKSELVKDAVEVADVQGKTEASGIHSMAHWLSDEYEKLIYDPESGYYFRVARSSVTERAFLERDLQTEKEVIVIDKDFNSVKTLKHHGRSFFYYFFIENKIYWNKDFKKHNLDAGNEDTILFDKTDFY
ncbi:DUF4221 family protein [Roseivirga sp.]|uniref:DUF4221 family protein n=1 Tax=Roseivirga sp. TaxID=1964215 RepID=UPI003B51F230